MPHMRQNNPPRCIGCTASPLKCGTCEHCFHKQVKCSGTPRALDFILAVSKLLSTDKPPLTHPCRQGSWCPHCTVHTSSVSFSLRFATHNGLLALHRSSSNNNWVPSVSRGPQEKMPALCSNTSTQHSRASSSSWNCLQTKLFRQISPTFPQLLECDERQKPR